MNSTAKRNLDGRSFSFETIGKNLACKASASDAVSMAGLDYEISKKDLTFRNTYGQDVRVPGQVALVKESSPARYLATVSTGYTLIQNLRLAEIVDGLFPNVPVSTVSDRNGKGLFLALRLGCFEIALDEIEEYLLVNEYRSAQDGLQISYFAGRLACHNGLLSPTSRWSVSLRHTSLVEERFKEITAAVAKRRDAGQDRLGELTQVEISENQVAKALADIYPAREVRFAPGAEIVEGTVAFREYEAQRQAAIQKAEGSRVAVYNLYRESGPEYGPYEGTAYHLLNAVAEYEQHLRPGRSDRSVAASATFGERAETLARSHDVLFSLG